MSYGKIKGAVTTDGFKDCIELESVHGGIARQIGTAARGAFSREHSEPQIHEISITKRMDASSPELFVDAVAGKLDNKVEIKFTTTTQNKVETFLTLTLENTGISNYTMSSGGDLPMESL